MPSQKSGGAAKPPPKDDEDQSRRFEEAARELESDESGKLFSRAMGKLVPTKRKRKASSSTGR